MFRHILVLILGMFLFYSCGSNSGTVYYPKSHFVALYEGSPANTDKRSYLFWGDKLESLKQAVTNTNKGSAGIYYYVKNTVDGKSGYVDAESVVMNPVSRAIIPANVIVYESPSMRLRNKQITVIPVLAYVTEIKDGEWAKIDTLKFYSTKFLMTNDSSVISPITYAWLKTTDLITNQSDVDMMIMLQMAVQKYKDWYLTASTEEKKTAVYKSSIKPDAENLRKMLQMDSQLNDNVRTMVNEYLNVVAPEAANETETPEASSEENSENTTPPSQEEL